MPSVQPTGQPTGNPSAMPSCTPSVAPTNPENMFLYYPDWSPGGSGCLNDGNHPPYMEANPSSHMQSTLAGCCATHFAWNYDACLGSLPGNCARVLFYPDSNGADQGCVDDGNEPSYMTDNSMNYMFSQLEDCCREHYRGNYGSCVGAPANANSGSTSSGSSSGTSGSTPVASRPTPVTSRPRESYYPEWVRSNNCSNNGQEPTYMTQNPTAWMHTTLQSCCEKNFNWNYARCMQYGS